MDISVKTKAPQEYAGLFYRTWNGHGGLAIMALEEAEFFRFFSRIPVLLLYCRGNTADGQPMKGTHF